MATKPSGKVEDSFAALVLAGVVQVLLAILNPVLLLGLTILLCAFQLGQMALVPEASRQPVAIDELGRVIANVASSSILTVGGWLTALVAIVALYAYRTDAVRRRRHLEETIDGLRKDQFPPRLKSGDAGTIEEHNARVEKALGVTSGAKKKARKGR